MNSAKQGFIHRLSAAPQALAYLARKISLEHPHRPCVLLAKSEHQALALVSQLAFLSPSSKVLHFPDRGSMPYDELSPSEEVSSQRLSALRSLPSLRSGFVVVALPSALTRLSPRSFILGSGLSLEVGQKLEPFEFASSLVKSGYRKVSKVMERGEFAHRGSVFDLFPMGFDFPLRLDFLGNEIESIHVLDPKTLEHLETKERINLSSAHEYPSDGPSISRFVERFEARFKSSLLESRFSSLLTGRATQGLESYLPLFFEESSSFFDYLPEDSLLIGETNEALSLEVDSVQSMVRKRFESSMRSHTPLLEPLELFFRKEEFFGGLKRFERYTLSSDGRSIVDLSGFSIRGLSTLKTWMGEHKRVLVFCASLARAQLLESQLVREGIPSAVLKSFEGEDLSALEKGKVTLCEADCLEGFYDPSIHLLALSAQDLGLSVRRVQSEREKKALFTTLDFQEGDYIVHRDYGVGRYLGLILQDFDGQTQECLHLEYEGGAELFVSLDELSRLYPYQSADDSPPILNRIGDKSWIKLREAAKKKAEDETAKLLMLYAKRQSQKGFAFSLDEPAYHEFVDLFPHQETTDQLSAIEACFEDMKSGRPMDRLLCGDVGLGKTEVALRAAFLSVQNRKQVAFLVPTTLLCEQHYERCFARFSPFGASVGMLSRFRSKKENQAVLDGLRSGEIDLVVGTHMLLSDSVKFKDLGLLLVDEEQRFGVKQKERFKRAFPSVDTLTMTATPIPRTMQMALSHWQDLSLIATPPKDRLPIRTFSVSLDSEEVDEAILREIGRGGQVYYLYNDVKNIEEFADSLRHRLGEGIRITVAHGQIGEGELESVMMDFYQHRFNVLVCSTIIETGLDVPNANTVIIHRAERLGLAQLHQIRGRVGRSHRQAYCYLVVPEVKLLTPEQKKRIDALLSHQELGAGFSLAMSDLDLRGAGDFLSTTQSGHMKSVSYHFYMDLIRQAIAKIQSGALKAESLSPMEDEAGLIELSSSKFLPAAYIENPVDRLVAYQSLGEAKSLSEVRSVELSLVERYGPLPEEAQALFAWGELKVACQLSGLSSVKFTQEGVLLEFSLEAKVEPEGVLSLIQSAPEAYRLKGERVLEIKTEMKEPRAKATIVLGVLERLGVGG